MHSINLVYLELQSSQHYIETTVTVTPMHVTFTTVVSNTYMLVFHQSNCPSPTKRMPFYYGHIIIFVFFHVFCVPCYCHACLNLLRCVWEWRRYIISQGLRFRVLGLGFWVYGCKFCFRVTFHREKLKKIIVNMISKYCDFSWYNYYSISSFSAWPQITSFG